MLGFFSNAKIIESLSTIKADTHNHKSELKEFKDEFKSHIIDEKKQTKEFYSKIDNIQQTISAAIVCPFTDTIEKNETKIHNLQITDIELENKIKVCKNESKGNCFLAEIAKSVFKKKILP
jgi:hypothetical protein